MGGTPDEVETSFYEALKQGDIDRLMECWAEEDEVVCVHPGGHRIVGLAAIRATFESLFSNGGSVHAQPEHIRRVEAMGSAVHSVLERVQVLTPEGAASVYVTATNVYHRTAQGWRLVLHHASPGVEGEPQEIRQFPQTLH